MILIIAAGFWICGCVFGYFWRKSESVGLTKRLRQAEKLLGEVVDMAEGHIISLIFERRIREFLGLLPLEQEREAARQAAQIQKARR
jgi:hypothetical protein